MAQEYKAKLEYSRLSERYTVLSLSGPTVFVRLLGVKFKGQASSVEIRAGDILTEEKANELGMFADLTITPKAELGGYSSQ